jgi:SAM-dependent methyltransferase
MAMKDNDKAFAGSIPQIYQQHLVPMIFEPYAIDLARRVAACRPANVLEIAAGTGAVTRQLARSLPPAVQIVATDLNPPMLAEAERLGTQRPVHWQPADAMQLPFPDASFDVVACQFGVMFFPDKAKAFAQMRRVLRPGGTLLFNVWDRLEDNDFAEAVVRALETLYPEEKPLFMERVPHGYCDLKAIARDLDAGGFGPAEIVAVPAQAHAPSPQEPAVGFCQGTPMRMDIETHGPDALARATEAAAQAIARQFGSGPVTGRLQALVGAARV